jgi:hypothetical protein
MNSRYSGLIVGERIPSQTGMFAGLISAGALTFGTLEGCALWEIGLVGLLPWIASTALHPVHVALHRISLDQTPSHHALRRWSPSFVRPLLR